MSIRRLAVWVTLCLLSCAGNTGGCFTLSPLPDGKRFEADAFNEAAVVQITDGGFELLNQNAEQLLTQWLPNQRLEVPLSCTIQSISPLGNVAIADQGSAGCSAESCGQLDGKCDSKDEPLLIPIELGNMSLFPQSPDILAVGVEASIQTGKIMIDTVSRNHVSCLFQNPAKCSLDVDTSRSGSAQNRLQLNIRFTVNTRWNQLTSFEVSDIRGTQLCGLPGAAASPLCLDAADIDVASEGPCQTCNAGDWAVVKSAVLALVGNQVKSALQNALNASTCQSCANGETCPSWSTSTSSCDADAGYCLDDVTRLCVPRALGIESRAVSPTSTPLDVLFALGGSAEADPGLRLGFRGGAIETETAACVPKIAETAYPQPGAPNFEQNASGPYDVGFSVSSVFLNRFAHHAHQAGLLCTDISHAQFSQLNSGLFTPLLPSLRLLTSNSEDTVPMKVVLRPQKPPKVRIEETTSLLNVQLDDLELDFYALVEERQARLFTLKLSVSLPLSVEADGCNDLTFAVGDLSQAVTTQPALNSEMLSEDLSVLTGLLASFISLAEPALAEGLGSFPLPTVGGFRVKVTDLKGMGARSDTQGYEHLGLLLDLIASNASCAKSTLAPMARLKDARIPTPERVQQANAPWPLAVLDLSLGGKKTDFSASVRIDNGLWSPFRPITDGTLEVTHPGFLFQGKHRIDIRAKDASSTASAPVSVDFTVDLERPTLKLKDNPASAFIHVDAFDSITPREKLQYAYRLGEDAWTPFGPARDVERARVEEYGSLSVRVRDEALLETEATLRTPKTQLRDEGPAPTQGCQSTTPALSWLSFLGLAVLRRPRAR